MKAIQPISHGIMYLLTFLRFNRKSCVQTGNATLLPQQHGENVINWMDGVFDNFIQVAEAKKHKLKVPIMHELVTANFTRHPYYPDTIIASYYYAKNSSDVFRFRYYTFQKEDEGFLGFIKFWDQKYFRMKIYRPTLSALQKLKRFGYNLGEYLPTMNDFEYLDSCDIIWKYNIFRSWHRGKLTKDKAEIRSQFNPNNKLYIKDDLKLWKHQLWINDRVFDQNGTLIIGNKYGIPYKLQRIM